MVQYLHIHELRNLKLKRSQQFTNEKFDLENKDQNENGGYWECEYCGAIYNQPQNWKPFADYCMKCKGEWK